MDTQPNSASNINPSPLNKRPIYIFILILIILAALVTAGAYFGKSYLIKQPTPAPAQKPITLTGLEIAQKTATFLDKTVQEDGSVIFIYGCSKTGEISNCTAPKSTGLRVPNGSIGLAYLILFQATNDTSYKEKAEKILEFALENCQANKNIKKCLNNVPALYRFYKETNDNQYRDAVLSVQSRLLTDKPTREYVAGWSLYGAQLAILYELTGDKKYLDRLEVATKDFLENGFVDDTKNPVFYKEGDFILRMYDIQVVWDYYIQAYRVTKNPVYLKAVEDFFNKANITNHLEDFKINENGENVSFLEALADLTELLDESEKKQIYLNLMYELANQASLDFWDNPDNPKFNGDSGFLINADTQNNRKPTVQSAWRIRHYIMMGSKVFRIQ